MAEPPMVPQALAPLPLPAAAPIGAAVADPLPAVAPNGAAVADLASTGRPQRGRGVLS